MSFVELLKKSREAAAQHIKDIAVQIIQNPSVEYKLDIIEKEFELEKRKVDHDKDGQSHPASYFTGLDEKTKLEREKEIERRQEEGIKAPELYEDLPGDEDSKTKPSKYTKHPKVDEIREEIKDSSKEEFIRASSKVSGVSKEIIEEVYDKGLKAWATSGHRPGAGPQQWAIARVYAFLFFPDSGARRADQHLWDKHLENKKTIINENIINDNNDTEDIPEASGMIEVKKTYNTIKQQLVKNLKHGLKQTKSKYHTPKLAKHALKLLNNNKLYLSDFELCFSRLQHQQDEKRLDYHLLGGDAMLQLQKHIKDGQKLNDALEMQYEGKQNEK